MRTPLLFAALTLASTLSGHAAIERVRFVQREGNALVLAAERETLRLTVLAPDIVRVQATVSPTFRPALMVQAGLVKTDWPPCEFTVNDSAEAVEIATAALTLRVAKAPFALELRTAAGAPLFRTVAGTGLTLAPGTCLQAEMTPADHFFGFGYMRKCFDARGQTLTWTRSYRNNEATVPFFMNPRGYAFFSNNTWKNDFDFTGTDRFSVATEDGDLDCLLLVGADFRRLLTLYTDLTGRPQLVPKWALGLEHRARYYDNAAALLETARLFRHHNIPCELLALEPGWEEKPYSMQWQWSAKRFPDPRGTIRELKRLGYKFDLWESGDAPKADLLNPQVRQAWFAKRAAALTDWGVDMFKQDDPYPRGIKSVGMEKAEKSDGEVTDVRYRPGEILTVANSFYSQTLFEEWRRLTGRRPVVQFHAYNASIGSQRWPYQWAGDFGTGWGLFNASLSGHPMVNADARSPYLDARHLDFFMSAGPVNDCWAYCIEPWAYADRLLEGCRMYASLRVRLYPYLYTALRVAHETGTPILRPMVFDAPRDEATYKLGSQFFLGDSLLVATSVGLDAFGDHARINAREEIPDYAERTTPVYLPQGTWIDYWTGAEYVAPTSRWVDCRFPSYAGGPLFVRAGSIIPTASVKHHVEQSPDRLITLDVYPGEASTTHRLYEDDGITFGYEQGQFANTTFSTVRQGAMIAVELAGRTGDYPGKPAVRDYLLKVHATLAPEGVKVDGQPLPPATKEALLFSATTRGWYYDAAVNKVIIKARAGWRFAVAGCNPAGTYPLTPAQEDVVFETAASAGETPQRIEIALNPSVEARVGAARQVCLVPENPRLLADGRSSVKIAVSVCDENGNVVETANPVLAVAVEGGGRAAGEVAIRKGRGEIVFTAPAQPGECRVRVAGSGLVAPPLALTAAAGRLQLVVTPRTKVPQPGKGEWLAKQFTIAVSARDAAGHRLATQAEVKLAIRDYRDRELIERAATMRDGEAEFRNLAYKTRPEKFLITATADGLEPASFKAFENAWHLPDDFLTDKANKDTLEILLPE